MFLKGSLNNFSNQMNAKCKKNKQQNRKGTTQNEQNYIDCLRKEQRIENNKRLYILVFESLLFTKSEVSNFLLKKAKLRRERAKRKKIFKIPCSLQLSLRVSKSLILNLFFVIYLFVLIQT